VVGEAWDQPRHHRQSKPHTSMPAQLQARPYGWILHLGPGQSTQTEATCWPMTRGPIHFECVMMTTSFPFGVLRKTVKIDLPGSVLVYPKLYRMNHRVLAQLSQSDRGGRTRLERAGGTEEFFGLRKYQSGDNIKQVDWKRSAKTGELVTREMTQPTLPRIMLALDLTHQDQPSPTAGTPPLNAPQTLTEHAISLAASLVCDAYFHGYPIGLMVPGTACSAFPVHHSQPHRTRILEALAQLDPTASSSCPSTYLGKPSVVITTGCGSAQRRKSGPIVLGAANLNQYIAPGENGSSLLNLRLSASPQRDLHQHVTQEVVA